MTPMTNTTTIKNPRTCRRCHRTFEASPADTTVNCPACRKAKRAVKGATVKAATVVSAAGRTCTVRGPISEGGHECGKPAAAAFLSRFTGRVFAECAEHAR